MGITAVSAGHSFAGLLGWGRDTARVNAEDGGFAHLGPQGQTMTNKTTTVTHGWPVDGFVS
jgi:hypothetical protein